MVRLKDRSKLEESPLISEFWEVHKRPHCDDMTEKTSNSKRCILEPYDGRKCLRESVNFGVFASDITIDDSLNLISQYEAFVENRFRTGVNSCRAHPRLTLAGAPPLLQSWSRSQPLGVGRVFTIAWISVLI